jgi:hypothetical protein
MRTYMKGYVLRQPIITCEICGKSYKKHKRGMHMKTRLHITCAEAIRKRQVEIEKTQDIDELKRRLNNLEEMMNEKINERK